MGVPCSIHTNWFPWWGYSSTPLEASVKDQMPGRTKSHPKSFQEGYTQYNISSRNEISKWAQSLPQVTCSRGSFYVYTLRSEGAITRESESGWASRDGQGAGNHRTIVLFWISFEESRREKDAQPRLWWHLSLVFPLWDIFPQSQVTSLFSYLILLVFIKNGFCF